MGRDIWLTAMGESGLRGLRFEAALLAPLMGRDDGKNGVAFWRPARFLPTQINQYKKTSCANGSLSAA